MSIKLYTTRLKCIFRNKEVIFWSYLFPIMLATCFFFAFNNLFSVEDFETIPIAYDSQGVEENNLKTIISESKMSEDTLMFQVTYCDKEEAKQLLKDDKIEGYIVGSTEPSLYVKENGMNQTIMKSFLDSYVQMQAAVHTILETNPNAINEGVIEDVMHFDNFVEEVKNQKNPESLLIYFYSLLAYTCLFAANGGLDEVINIQADQSIRGARVNVSPINKMKLFLCNLAASFTSHIISLILLFLYLYYALKVNFGDNLFYLFLICLIGSLTGLAIGATIGVWVKKKAEVKESIVTMVVLGGAFLSGMMIADMKFLVAENFPLLAYINPVNLVTDAMYSLYYFDTYDRFYLNAAILCVITVLLGVASYVGIRRKKFETKSSG